MSTPSLDFGPFLLEFLELIRPVLAACPRCSAPSGSVEVPHGPLCWFESTLAVGWTERSQLVLGDPHPSAKVSLYSEYLEFVRRAQKPAERSS